MTYFGHSTIQVNKCKIFTQNYTDIRKFWDQVIFCRNYCWLTFVLIFRSKSSINVVLKSYIFAIFLCFYRSHLQVTAEELFKKYLKNSKEISLKESFYLKWHPGTWLYYIYFSVNFSKSFGTVLLQSIFGRLFPSFSCYQYPRTGARKNQNHI